MLWIARRWLLSPKSHSVVNIIAWVSMVSLLLPVAAVVILLSVFNGFSQMLATMERSSEGDLTIRLFEGRLFDTEQIDTEAIRAIEGVEALSQMSEMTLLLRYRDVSEVVTLRGVDSEWQEVVALDKSIVAGSFDPQREDGLLIGRGVASRLGVRSLQGVEIELLALRSTPLGSLLSISDQSRDMTTLTGIFSLDEESDNQYAYTSQQVVNRLIGRHNRASQISIKVAEGANIERLQQEIGGVVGDGYRVMNRGELNPTLHQIVQGEKMGVLLICSFVILLASFSLMGALSMLIIEKRGEVTTLRAIGMSRGGILRLFFGEGVMIGGVAIVVGAVVGAVVTLSQQTWGFVELPTSSMMRMPYPVLLQWGDMVMVVAIAGVMVVAISYLVTRTMSK